MADSAKWSYREPAAVASGRVSGSLDEKQRERKLNRLLKTTASTSGSSTGVGSTRRGGSRNVDENMDGPSSRRFNVLDRQGRNAPTATTRVARDKLPNIDIIIDFVHRKYNPAAQFLSFDNIFQDQLLRSHGIDRWQLNSSQDKLADALWKAAGELDPPVRSIDAANNNMTRWQLHRLPQFLPHVQSISLRSNKIETMHDLERFWTRGGKGGLKNLVEIWLLGNPIRDNAEKYGNIDEYLYNMQSYIRTLKIVDGTPIMNVTWDAAEHPVSERSERWPDSVPYPSTFPLPVSPSSFDPNLQGMLTNVLSNFFSLYDNNRKALVNAYVPEATFSFSSILSSPPRIAAAPYKAAAGITAPSHEVMRNLQSIPAAPNRNLKGLPQAAVRLDSLHQGPAAILAVFDALPSTRHPLQEGSKFVFDATLLPDSGSGEMLAVTVHGEFTTPELGNAFSFSRSFLFVPAPEGSPAQQMGLNVLILSDMLSLKRPTPALAWVPGPIITQEEAYMRGGRPPRTGGKATAAAPSAAQGLTMAVDAPSAPQHISQPQQPMQQFQQPVQPQFPQQQPQSQPIQQQVPLQPPQITIQQQPVQQPRPIPPQPAPAPTPSHSAPVPSSGVQVRYPDGWDNLPEEHRTMALFFSQQTGLQPGAACSLLEVNNWDASVTFQQFVAVKDGIPPEFWLNPPTS